MGPAAVLVEDPPGDTAAWSLALRALAPVGVIDIVPAARTVLISCESPAALAGAVERLAEVGPTSALEAAAAPPMVIDVHYDGDDLHDVARSAGLSVDDVVALHSGAIYTVAFCGFAPGFGYLRGLPEMLQLPRRATPRTRVPAGSVAIAAEFSAVYPSESPGGWHLLGRTDAVLFDGHREPPALLAPGMLVRFRSI